MLNSDNYFNFEGGWIPREFECLKYYDFFRKLPDGQIMAHREIDDREVVLTPGEAFLVQKQWYFFASRDALRLNFQQAYRFACNAMQHQELASSCLEINFVANAIMFE